MATRGTKRTSMAKRRRTSTSMVNEDVGKSRGGAKRSTRKTSNTMMKEETVGRRGVRSKQVSRVSTRVTGGRKSTRKTTRK